MSREIQEEIQRESDDQNSPSTAKLFAVLRAQGVQAKFRDVEAFVKRQAVLCVGCVCGFERPSTLY